jgi:1,4-dihydroxy-2-naphthoyl-CoA hydrolase
MKKTVDLLWDLIRDEKTITMVETMGIEIEHIDEKSIRASMPVDQRTTQYYGMLHGGASVALAETLASLGALVHVDPVKEMVVGLEINANHLRSATSGRVVGEGKPIHVGRKTQVWSIEIKNAEGKLLCVSRCTIAVIPRTV